VAQGKPSELAHTVMSRRKVRGSPALLEVTGGHPRGAVHRARHQLWFAWARCLHQRELTQPPGYCTGSLVYVAVDVWRSAVFLVVTAEHRMGRRRGHPNPPEARPADNERRD
jgi:hypothetical protein